jgi:hypothetical protein
LRRTAWWRTQSQSNLSQQNSLLTGKITGNFADSGLNPQFWWRVSWRIQSLKAKFPAKREQGIFPADEGINFKEQGIAAAKVESRPEG